MLIKEKLNNLSKNNLFNSEDINKNNLDRYLGIIEEEPSNIIDFINRETILVIDELEDCKKFAKNWYLDSDPSRGLGDVYKRQIYTFKITNPFVSNFYIRTN